MDHLGLNVLHNVFKTLILCHNLHLHKHNGVGFTRNTSHIVNTPTYSTVVPIHRNLQNKIFVAAYLIDKSRFLQQVLLDHCSLNHTMCVEVDVDVLAKSTRVVISIRFGIPKCCELEKETRNEGMHIHTHMYRKSHILRSKETVILCT